MVIFDFFGLAEAPDEAVEVTPTAARASIAVAQMPARIQKRPRDQLVLSDIICLLFGIT
jgi:hypothetical protein